ncbi:hypothetical protein CMQ_1844 [Grosmannia clavigera kw1407]|uniref:WD repeat protein n=1 Tax=Grosmannia clavigera (strain kw1407 / UAMH 11150) TaxID=655863 RepID=F0XNI1_GROCL|nr:uncharacterized protein CMQ_1844 [Grosmannia clavigera kw1407]EFX00763.1 hypothetical protein CMQ_1844 [Grosmannia clavigera kw1407]
MSDTVSSIETLTLDLPPSCIEFCPAHPDYFLVGTYDLEQDEKRASGDSSRPQNRNGSVLIFQLQDKKLLCLQTEPQPSAVLDLHFQHKKDRQDVFAVASSTATLTIYRLSPSRYAGGLLESLGTVSIPGVGEDVLFLACAWHPDIPDLIAISTSSGAVYILNLLQTGDSGGVDVQPVILHHLEAWTVAFQPAVCHQTLNGTVVSTLYSGGDDSKLRYTSCTVHSPSAPKDGLPPKTSLDACILSGHGAGVTAILPLPIDMSDGGKVVLTGSYDDHIRVYSIQSPLDTGGAHQTSCLASKHLGGGVWRLKLVRQQPPDEDNCWQLRVLASCMHAGVRILDINGDTSGNCQIYVVTRFEEHKSMNYGSDVQPGLSSLCVSTSFYDRLLCLWEMIGTE